MTEGKEGWLALRDIVLARRLPRRMLVQPLTHLDESAYTVLHYVILCILLYCKYIYILYIYKINLLTIIPGETVQNCLITFLKDFIFILAK